MGQAAQAGGQVLSGPGDDCAVVRPTRRRELVLKVDEVAAAVA